uniref:Uncharacterized protein n=1 Tax=Knipowitschia caucasica TaxID=637954 RepID=A0AAV2KCZ5_KNICA
MTSIRSKNQVFGECLRDKSGKLLKLDKGQESEEPVSSSGMCVSSHQGLIRDSSGTHYAAAAEQGKDALKLGSFEAAFNLSATPNLSNRD